MRRLLMDSRLLIPSRFSFFRGETLAKQRRYVKVSLKREFMEKIKKFIEDHPELGYRSLSQFVEDAVRRRAEELCVYATADRKHKK